MQTTNKLEPIEFIRFIESVPTDWHLLPVAGKAPTQDDWTTPVTKAKLLATINNPRVTGLGLLFGKTTELIGIDHDGESCDRTIEEITGLSINEALPETVCVTSGRTGRYTKIYRVPSQYLEQLSYKKIKTGVHKEQIEIRWDGFQSVVFGIHPTTNQPYYWLNSPQDTVIAECPKWILEYATVDLEKINNTKSAKNVDEKAKAEKLMGLIDPNKLDWEEWRNCLMAAHHADIDRDFAWDWSRQHSEADERRFDDIWEHLKGIGNNLRETGTLFFHAKAQGWVPENPKASSRTDEIIKACSDWIKIRDEGTSAGKLRYWYYSFSKKYWISTYNTTVIYGAIEQFCLDNDIPYEPYKGIDPITAKTVKIVPVVKALERMGKDVKNHIQCDPIQNTKVIAFENVCYNTETNTRMEHSPKIGNHSILNFELPDDIPEDWGTPFLEFNQAWCKTDIDATLLKFIWAIGARQVAGDYMIIAHLIGSTQIGKTQFARSIVYPYCENVGEYYRYLAQIPCKSGDNGKASAPDWNVIRRETKVAFIDEFYDYTKGIDSIKEAGNINSSFLINEKYRPVYNLPRQFPILAASEIAPKMAHNFNEGIYSRLYFVDLLHWSNALMRSTEFSSGVSMMDKLTETYINPIACRKYYFWCLAHLDTEQLDEMYREIISTKSQLKSQIIESNTGVDTMVILLAEHYTISLNSDDYVFVNDLIDRYHTIESIESSSKSINDRFRLTTKGFNAKLEGYLQSTDHPLYLNYQRLKDKAKSTGKPSRKRNPKTSDHAPVLYGIKEIPTEVKSF